MRKCNMLKTDHRASPLMLTLLVASSATAAAKYRSAHHLGDYRSSSALGPNSAGGRLRRGAGGGTDRAADNVGIGIGIGVSGTISFPLVPHSVHVERRRRASEEAGIASGDLDVELMRYYEDEARFEGWPRRRHLKTAAGGVDDHGDASATAGRKPPEVSPLYQGYGTHYVDLWLGHPSPQRQTVIVDTGSGITAFPCSGCPDDGCGEGYHTDNPYNDGASDTFSRVAECNQCTMGRCKPTYGLDDKGSVVRTGGECRVSMSYQEGSSWEAYEAEDWVYAGGAHDVPSDSQDESRVSLVVGGGDKTGTEAEGLDGADPALAPAYRFRLRFACQTLLTGLFKTQLADGIMGMENSATSFWYQMYDTYASSAKSFSLCFSRGANYEADALHSGIGAGALTLGGLDERLHVTPVVYADNIESRGWYTVYVSAVYLRAGGGESASPPDGFRPDVDLHNLDVDPRVINDDGIIVDSGTTDTYLPSFLGKAFKKAWRAATGNDPPEPKHKVTLSPQELAELPTLLVQLRSAKASLPTDPINAVGVDPANFPGLAGGIDPKHPNDVLLAIPAVHYMEQKFDGAPGEYSMRLHFTEGSGGVLGANAMMGHDCVFDVENGRVGFAESLCDYGKVRKGKEDESR